MPNPATLLDIENRWRPLTNDEYGKAQTLLNDAWTLLKHNVYNLESRLTIIPPAAAPTLDAGLVTMVVIAMVVRVLRNPDGKRQESIEDYSYTRDAQSASGELMVTGDELAMLVPTSATPTGAFTITPWYDTAWWVTT